MDAAMGNVPNNPMMIPCNTQDIRQQDIPIMNPINVLFNATMHMTMDRSSTGKLDLLAYAQTNPAIMPRMIAMINLLV
jgi:hypothetical protein